MIAAGELNKRVTLLVPGTGAQNDYGARAVTYTDGATVWAKVVSSPTSESEVDRRNLVTGSYVVTIRYRADVTTRHRVRYAGKTLSVTGLVNLNETSTELVLTCGEVN